MGSLIFFILSVFKTNVCIYNILFQMLEFLPLQVNFGAFYMFYISNSLTFLFLEKI